MFSKNRFRFELQHPLLGSLVVSVLVVVATVGVLVVSHYSFPATLPLPPPIEADNHGD